jgi:cell division protein FtsW (lipid II flippase)
LIQRDLGTATLFILIYTITLYLASGRKRMILLSLSTLTLAGYLGYHLVGVVRTRVDAWINPWLDPSGNSYQIIQSIMAVASGGLFGRGPVWATRAWCRWPTRLHLRGHCRRDRW